MAHLQNHRGTPPGAQNRIAYYRDRCRPPLTQAGLARALGVHVNTIQHWERLGAPGPADLLRLVELFVARGAIRDLEAAMSFWEVSGREPWPPPRELDALFEQPAATLADRLLGAPPAPAPLPAHSWMPLGRNPLFVGRDGELRALAAALVTGEVVAIAGMGGIGKTQLACEFAHRYGQLFAGGVFWLSFADPSAVPAEIAGCGGAGGMELRPTFGDLSLDEQVRLVRAAWQLAVPRLLVFDNCEDEGLLARWRPASGGCRVIVTSRRARWDAALGVQPLPLTALGRAESVALLRRHRPDLLEDDPDLAHIAAALGDHPLALHLAGSFLGRYRAAIAPAAYLSQLHGASILRHPSLFGGGVSPTRHRQHVMRTLMVSYERLDPRSATDALALALLSRAACFAPGEPIPREILLSSLALDATDWTAVLHAENALARLIELGLLAPAATSPDAAVSMHRLLVRFVETVVADPSARPVVEAAVLERARQLSHDRLPAPMLAFQRHLRAVTDAATPRADARAADLCAELGWQLVLLSASDDARPYLDRALAIRETVWGGEHPQTADALSLLGLCLQFSGSFVAARPFFERALAICERTLGPDHTDTATACNNLGYLLLHLDDHMAARAYLARALRIRRRLFELRDAETARVLSNLGYVLLHDGQIAAARRYLKLALAIREQVLAENSPATAQTLNNLGEALFAAGDYAEALRYHERALAMRDQVFGAGNFHAAESLRNLGRVLHARGDLRGARVYLERALAICEATIGERHVETAWKLETLADVLADLEGPSAARPYYERALATYLVSFDPHHPSITRVRARLDSSRILQRG